MLEFMAEAMLKEGEMTMSVKFCAAISLLVSAAFTQALNVVWTRTYGGGNDDNGFSVDRTDDGGFVIVGNTCSFGAGLSDLYLIKTDCLGNVVWYKVYGGASDDAGHCVRQTTDGGFIIVGSVEWSGMYDLYVVKTDSAGIISRATNIGGPNGERGCCVQEVAANDFVIAEARHPMVQVFLTSIL